MKRHNPFIALSSAAMSLPVFAASQPVETTVSLKASTYKEDDISSQAVISGANSRYDIDIGQFRLVAPVGSNWSIEAGYAQETMSGASPWATLLGVNGDQSLIMSGATIRDSRSAADLTLIHYSEDRSISLGLAHSDEDDYEAKAITLGGEWEFNNKLSTLSLGFSYSTDDLSPVDAVAFGRIVEAEKRTRSMSVGYSRVINKVSAISSTLNITQHDGYLSDPYKLRDVRPDERTEWALSLRYRRFFDNRNAALHLDYRYFNDDWGIDSHTIYSAWYQSIGARFQIAPNIRLYSQREADFYLAVDNFSLPRTTAQSSDFRLSGYGAWSLGLKAIFRADTWDVTLSYDQYSADESKGLSASDTEHPALLDFQLTSIGFNFRF
jgi:hypothetical protein